MSNKLEDFAGRAAMVAIFSIGALHEISTISSLIRTEDSVAGGGLILTSRVVGLIFLSLVIFFTVKRLPAKASASGISPRLLSIAGTFLMSVLVLLPVGVVGPEARLFATVMVVVGTLLSSYCLFWLGRSFSIMASARKLVTGGPYKIVRHPLYVAEAITMIGIAIENWSIASVALVTGWFAIQYCRASIEERVLRDTFPEYQDYARRVPMLSPFSLSKMR